MTDSVLMKANDLHSRLRTLAVIEDLLEDESSLHVTINKDGLSYSETEFLTLGEKKRIYEYVKEFVDLKKKVCQEKFNSL